MQYPRVDGERDSLQELYQDLFKGDDYNADLMHGYREMQINHAMQYLKGRGLMHETDVIDTPLQRHALAAYLKSLYPPGHDDSETDFFPRHGRYPSDLENYARTQHMERFGFDPDGSASYDPTSEQAMRDRVEASSFLWGKCSHLLSEGLGDHARPAPSETPDEKRPRY